MNRRATLVVVLFLSLLLLSAGPLPAQAGDLAALAEPAPLAWQEIGEQGVPWDLAPAVSGSSAADFRLGAYNRLYSLAIDPIYEWHTFYGAGSDADFNAGVAVDWAGNIYLAGMTWATWQGPGGEEPLHPYTGERDVVVVKLDPDGGYLWHTFYGSSSWDQAYGMDVDAAGNVYVTGGSASTWEGPGPASPLHAFGGWDTNVMVLKLDSSGTYRWHTFYGASDVGMDLAIEGGSVYVTGTGEDTWLGDGDTAPLHPYAWEWDVSVLKLDTDGTYQWHTFYGGLASDASLALDVDGAGSVYVGGLSEDTWQGDGNVDPLHPYAAGGAADMLVVKLDATGAYQWHTFYGGSSNLLSTASMGQALAADPAGHVYATGPFDGSWQGDGGIGPIHPHSGGANGDIAVLKLDKDGAYQWHTFYGSAAGNDLGMGVALDVAGDIYVAGYSEASWQGDGATEPLHPYSGDDDILLFKLNNSGAYQWHTFYGSATGSDGGTGVALDHAGNIHVAGASDTTWQGDGGAEPLHAFGPPGQVDLMVLKLASDAVTMSIDPVAGGTLVYTDTQGLTTTLQVPSGAVGACTDLVYTPLLSPTETLNPSDEYARHAFLLHTYPCGGQWRVYLPLLVRGGPSSARQAAPAAPRLGLDPNDPVFQEPALMAIHYSDADVAGINENTLRVVYWTGSAWEDMAGTCGTPPVYVRDVVHNVIRFTFCHMSQGALVGQ